MGGGRIETAAEIIKETRCQEVPVLSKYGELLYVRTKTLIISKKPGNTGKSRDKDTEFTTHLLHSEGALTRCPFP